MLFCLKFTAQIYSSTDSAVADIKCLDGWTLENAYCQLCCQSAGGSEAERE